MLGFLWIGIALLVVGIIAFKVTYRLFEREVIPSVFVSLVSLIVVSITCPLWESLLGGIGPTGQGEISGTVYSTSWEGILFKTYEIRIKTDNQASTDIHLSTPDEELGKTLSHLLGTKVVLSYDRYLINNARKGDSKLVVTRINKAEGLGEFKNWDR